VWSSSSERPACAAASRRLAWVLLRAAVPPAMRFAGRCAVSSVSRPSSTSSGPGQPGPGEVPAGGRERPAMATRWWACWRPTAAVGHGRLRDDGLDELSVTSPSTVLDLFGDARGYEVLERRLDPSDFGIARRHWPTCAEVTPLQRGRHPPGARGERSARRDIGLLNAAAAMVLCGGRRHGGGYETAEASVDSASQRWSSSVSSRCPLCRHEQAVVEGRPARLRSGALAQRVRRRPHSGGPAGAMGHEPGRGTRSERATTHPRTHRR